LLIGASHAWRPDRSVKFTYHQLKSKYNGERLDVDATMQGLYVGVGFRFGWGISVVDMQSQQRRTEKPVLYDRITHNWFRRRLAKRGECL